MPHTIWFASDLHLGHANILKYDKRPFASIDEHDEALIQNWNARVRRGDTVYYLGDFSMTGNRDRIWTWVDRLCGEVHLLIGNHDSDAVIKHCRWRSVSDRKRIKNPWRKHRIVLDHFPARTWWSSHHGSWHLHGHTHGALPHEGTLRLDVGVMNHDYAPISFEEVREILESREPEWRESRSFDPHVASRCFR